MQQYICINYIIVKNKYFVLDINKYKKVLIVIIFGCGMIELLHFFSIYQFLYSKHALVLKL